MTDPTHANLDFNRDLLMRLHGADAGGDDPICRITRHLVSLFNTRPGDNKATKAYGLTHLRDIVDAFPRAAEHLRREMMRLVACFEPRLTGVVIQQIDDPSPLQVSFCLDASLRTQRSQRHRWLVRLNHHGRIFVSSAEPPSGRK